MSYQYDEENMASFREFFYLDSNSTHSDRKSEIENSNSTYLSLIGYPILLIICTIGNILNVVVLSRLENFQTKEVFLISLAVSDLLVMWLGVPLYLDLHANYFGITHSLPTFIVQCKGSFVWLHFTFYYLSDGLLILFSCERLMAFRWSNYHRGLRSRRHCAIVVVALVTMLSAFICLGHLIDYYVWEVLISRSFLDMDSRIDKPSWLESWNRMQNTTDIILPILSLITILIVNVWLLRFLQENLALSREFRSRTTSVQNQGGTLNRNNTTSTGSSRPTVRSCGMSMYIPLLGCAALYCVTQFPAVVINTMVFSETASKTNRIIQHLQPIGWILSKVNYSVNFLLYAGLSRKYRYLLKDVLCGNSNAVGFSRELGDLRDMANPLLARLSQRPISKKTTLVTSTSISTVRSVPSDDTVL